MAMEATVFGFVNDAHAASAEVFENAVVGESLADELVGAGHERGHVRWRWGRRSTKPRMEMRRGV